MSRPPITKAIIPVAGWGTRRLPITKAIEKCMLPIGNRPIVDFVVQDCIKAGITDIYFVVGEDSQQIQTYYGENTALETYLQERGKNDVLKIIKPLSDVNFHFVTQPAQGKYGTAVPLELAAPHIEEDESAVVVMGDDFVYDESINEIARLIDSAEGDIATMLGVAVAQESVSRYGVIETDQAGNYVRIVEKPQPEDAPSNLINVSKYVLPGSLIHLAQSVEKDPSGEYFLTTLINDYVAQGGIMKVVQAQGDYYDGGSLEGWLHANNTIGKL